ncbi:MAG: glycosyltransferase family 2 protein [bacterium]
MIKYSFIIPVKEINDYIKESVPKILKSRRDDFEIIIYPDQTYDNVKFLKTRQIASGPGGPAMKRNLAMRDALGEILIFIDDDAYPQEDFLNIIDEDFKNSEIAAVGGPAVTPENDSFWQKISGAVFLSSLSGGCPERYAPIGKKRQIDDWPSVNLSIRKKVFKEINGFDCEFWPGEDTKLCLDVIKNNKKILYNPNLIVYHHRRAGLVKHLKQVSGYGIHRGFFAKKYPETSFKLKYFLPSLFLIFLFFGAVLSFADIIFFKIYLFGLVVYCLAILKALVDIRKHEKNILVALNAIYYILFTHLVYGFKFIQGFVFVRELRSKLR